MPLEGSRVLLWRCLALRGGLPLGCRLTLLLDSLALLLLRSLALLRLTLLLDSLPLLQLRSLALLLNRLMLLDWLVLLLDSLMLLLGGGLVVSLQRGRGSDVAIGGKRLIDGHGGRAAMVDIGKLGPVGAGGPLILDLRPHGSGMLLALRR